MPGRFQALLPTPSGAARTRSSGAPRGIVVSILHALTGGIVGDGAARSVRGRWGVARRIVTAWFITIPAAGVIGALIYRTGGAFLI